MPRAALSLPPSFGTINEKQDAYLFNTQLRQVAKQTGRYWSFHSVPTTVALPAGRFAKSWNSFSDHSTEDALTELIREYSEYGVPRPSSYADVFHETFKSPRVPWSVNALFAPCLAGGWQQALKVGVSMGIYRKYDMRSAYLWAASLGLPDTRTYQRSLSPWKTRYDGLYRVKLIGPSEGAPFPYNQCFECIATHQEIETYNLRVSEVVDGVIWKRTIAGDGITEAVRKVSTWKQAGRSYWGRWGQMAKVSCVANGKTWQLPNMALNVPWAHLIVSRVKMRLWEHSRDALHVYVDSVITPAILPTGTNVGDWRLEKEYNGVFIRGPGQYGAVGDIRLERMAGVGINSLQRNTSVAIASAGQSRTF